MKSAIKKSLNVDDTNYLSIVILEKLGLTSPSQKQIDLLELLFSTVIKTRKITQHEVNANFKNYEYAKYVINKYFINLR